MKKTVVVFISVTLILLVGVFSLYSVLTSPKYEGEFSIDSFSDEIDRFSFESSGHFGNITDYQSAAKAGMNAIEELFGEESAGSFFEWRGCTVKYDTEHDVYHIRTFQMFPPVLGGAYNALIRSDGTGLAVWGEK